MAYVWAAEFIPSLLPQSIIDKLPTAEVDYGLTTPQGQIHEYVTLRNCATNGVIKLVPSPNARRVSRRRFRQVLREGLDVQYGKNVTEITYPETGVVVHFEDGTEVSGSLVIGADGGGSRVRRLLLGEAAEPTILPIVMNNFNVKYTAEQALFIRANLARFTDYGIHPKGLFYLMSIQDVGDPNDPSTWSFQLLTSWPTSLRALPDSDNTSAGRLKILKELTADFSEPRRSAMQWVPDDFEVPKDRLAIWSPVPWDHHGGRVTLAGDAAHGMTYHRGQGLNNCLNDAANLVAGIVAAQARQEGRVSMDEVLGAYGVEVVQRGAAEVGISAKQSIISHDWERFMDSPVVKMGVAPLSLPNGFEESAVQIPSAASS